LASLELAYAPPYSSAKDPVNMLGYIAENLMQGLVKTFEWSDVDRLKAEGAYFLDVREDFELDTGVIEGSHQIPLNQLRERIDEVPTDQPIYVLCQVGLRGYNAARVLMQHGREAINLDGGYKTYKQATFTPKPIASRSASFSQGTVMTQPVDSFTPAVHIDVDPADVIQVDACGLQCPGPILKVKSHIDQMSNGQVMEIQASDFGFSADINAWCENTGNTLLENRIDGNKVIAKIAKGTGAMGTTGAIGAASVENGALLPAGSTELGGANAQLPDGATIVLFSGDLDKAIAAMIIASGAAAYGKNVTIFCTFWGLNVLKDKERSVEKRGMAKMFDVMMPSSASHLPLSQMNMGGMGAAMIKQVMRNKNVDSLPTMIEKAHELGVKFIACTMSMDLMGVSKDELFDFVEFGGVGAYIGDSEKANIQLFI
jgi:peroxiredoxin family protein/rhodanese-related sulfurtransferase/TusA-related sulfurtransferase